MLRAGDWVQVRSEQDILTTLGADGKLDGMPFMPEMLQFCGRRMRVFRRADKTCDTIATYQSRRLTDTVHLEDVRCDGCAHGGCEAGCLLFWKEAWLQPVNGAATASPLQPTRGGGATRAALEAGTTRPDPAASGSGERLYVCQSTELLRASARLRWFDPRQYLRELRSGNVRLGKFLRTLVVAWYNVLLRRLFHRRYPNVVGTLTKTPTARLDLQPGERVRVRSQKEIVATLNPAQKNRGLSFDVEMVGYCLKEFKVLRRVRRIVDDRTGKMLELPGDCIVLDGVVCQGCLSTNRLFCPRSIYPYWREIWLERAP
jgi:hypothetical protein